MRNNEAVRKAQKLMTEWNRLGICYIKSSIRNFLDFNASQRASESTTGPLEALIKIAVCFMLAKAAIINEVFRFNREGNMEAYEIRFLKQFIYCSAHLRINSLT